MKTINKIRSTDKYHILGSEIKYLQIIQERFGSNLVSVAKTDPNTFGDYTVRVAEEYEIKDHTIRVDIVFRTVQIKETEVIR